MDQLTGFSGSPWLKDIILLPVPSLATFWVLKSTDCCFESSPQEIEGLNCASGVADRPFSYQHTGEDRVESPSPLPRASPAAIPPLTCPPCGWTCDVDGAICSSPYGLGQLSGMPWRIGGACCNESNHHPASALANTSSADQSAACDNVGLCHCHHIFPY